MSCCIVMFRVIRYCAVPCRVVFYRAVLCCVVPCVMLCCVVLCCDNAEVIAKSNSKFLKKLWGSV